MNKTQFKMQKAVHTGTGRKQLISQLEELRDRLENPELTQGEFQEIRVKVQELQELLKKVV